MIDIAEAPETIGVETPKTAAEMATYYERVTACEDRLISLDNYERGRIQGIKDACQRDRQRIEAEREMWTASILAFLEQLGDERVRLPDLGVSLAAKKDKGLRWTDEAALKEWAKAHDLLNPPPPPNPTPNKKAIQEHYATTGECPDGAEVKSGTVLSISHLRGGK